MESSKRQSKDLLDEPAKREVGSEFVHLGQNEYYFPRRKRSSSGSDAFDIPGTSASFRRLSTSDYEFGVVSGGEVEDEEEEGEQEEERLASFKDSLTQPGGSDDSSDEWEEYLLYVDLDDIPSVDELFAVEPDDLLTFQSRRQRELPKAQKETLPMLNMRFYNLDTSAPILQIGSRYYLGKYQDAFGSSLMFKKKTDSAPEPAKTLPSLVREPLPPRDKVYHEKLKSNQHVEYELVANVPKVLKMTRKEVRLANGDLQLLPPTPAGLPPDPPSKFPRVFTGRSSLSLVGAGEGDPIRKPGPSGLSREKKQSRLAENAHAITSSDMNESDTSAVAAGTTLDEAMDIDSTSDGTNASIVCNLEVGAMEEVGQS